MTEKTAESAVDIIYGLPEKLDALLGKISALEARNSMLEAKLNTYMIESAKKLAILDTIEVGQDSSFEDEEEEDDSESEIMDVAAPSKQAPQQRPAPAPLPKVEPAPLPPTPPVLKQPEKPNTFAEVPERIRLDHVEVDPFGPPTQQPKTIERPKIAEVHVKGTLRNPKTNKGEDGIEVKIYDAAQVLKKKTKTAAGGKWLAFLKAGDYTIEFSRPDKPIFKNITIIEGQREFEVLV